MEDCYSEVRGFEPLSGTLPLADIKISNQYHATCCAIARLATLSRFMYRYLSGEWKKLILYIKRLLVRCSYHEAERAWEYARPEGA